MAGSLMWTPGGPMSWAFVLGGGIMSGDASGNTVTLSGGSAAELHGGHTESGNATGNTVTISGGTVTGTAAGGYTASGNAVSNTVNLTGSPVLTNAVLYGGLSAATGNDVTTGNTLNVYSTGLSAGNIANFGNLNFYLPADITNGTNVLTLTRNADTDLTNTRVTAYLEGDANLTNGDTINLIHRTGTGSLITTGMIQPSPVMAMPSRTESLALMSRPEVISRPPSRILLRMAPAKARQLVSVRARASTKGKSRAVAVARERRPRI